MHRPASADDGSLLFWASFFAIVKGRASSRTSPMRWEAHLCETRVFTHDPVSPAWGHSVHSQIVGKLGHCKVVFTLLLAPLSDAKLQSTSFLLTYFDSSWDFWSSFSCQKRSGFTISQTEGRSQSAEFSLLGTWWMLMMPTVTAHLTWS